MADTSKIEPILAGLVTQKVHDAFEFLSGCTWPEVPRDASGELDKNAPDMQFVHIIGNTIEAVQSSKGAYADGDMDLTDIMREFHKDADRMRKPIALAEEILPPLNPGKGEEIAAAAGELKAFQERIRNAVANLVHESKHEHGLG